jgi:hypothetical protein
MNKKSFQENVIACFVSYLPPLVCVSTLKTLLHNNILTFIIVTLETGTNFPAVSLNSLLAVAMMRNRQR